MRFELISDNPNSISAESLKVTAETAAEVWEVAKHYGIAKDPEAILALAPAIAAGRYEYITKPSPKRSWFDVDVYLTKSLDPYRKLLERITGYNEPIPDMELTAKHPRRLGHQYVVNTAEIKDGMLHENVFIQAQEWNNRDAATNAQMHADDYVMEYYGKRRFEREYIPTANGQYKQNPNYLKRHPAEPGLGSEWLWSVIFAWWRANHASQTQRNLLDGIDALVRYDPEYSIRKGGGDEAHLVGLCGFYVLDPLGSIDWDGKGKKASHYSWEEFRTGKPVLRAEDLGVK